MPRDVAIGALAEIVNGLSFINEIILGQMLAANISNKNINVKLKINFL